MLHFDLFSLHFRSPFFLILFHATHGFAKKKPIRMQTECHCSPHGSVTQTCHKHTGQCTCRANVIGRICDRCADGFWQLESGVGCHSCACNAIGSQAHTCDTYTGQCSCKQGVGGTACDSCLDGFYAFSANGCKRK